MCVACYRSDAIPTLREIQRDAKKIFAAWERGSAPLSPVPQRIDNRAPLHQRRAKPLEFPVIPFFERIKQIGGGMQFTVVFDLFVAFDFHHAAILQFETVSGALQICFFN